MLYHACIVMLIIHSDIIACLVRTAAQCQIVLLHHLTAVHIIGIFLGKIILLKLRKT